MITAMPRIAIAVTDFAAAVTTFRDVFGLPVTDFSERTVPTLGAHIGICQPPGGSNVELMSPANPTLPLSHSLQKFLDRRGDGLYALMLEAADPDVEAGELSTRGLDVLPLMVGASGRDVHPRSTHGVLIRVYPCDSVRNPDGLESVAPGLSGIAKVIIATRDAAKAVEVYGRGFGLASSPVTLDKERGVLSARCNASKGGVIEVVSASDTSRPFAQEIEQFVKENNEGMFALVLQCEDPAAGVSLLQARGLDVGGATGAEATVFGARFSFEAASR